MKPHELRARRQQRATEKAARGEKLEAYLRSGSAMDVVVPDLVPTEQDRTAALREYRRRGRLAAGETRGTDRHAQQLDAAVTALAHVVYIERVLALDPLTRAALTPARLVELSAIRPEDLQARLNGFQGVSSVEVVSR